MIIDMEMFSFSIRILYKINLEKHTIVTENQRHINAHVLAYDVVRCQQFNTIFAFWVLSFVICLLVALKKNTHYPCGCCCCNVLTSISFLWCCPRMRNNTSEAEMWIPKLTSVDRSELCSYSVTLSVTDLHRYLWLFIGAKYMYFHPIAREQIGRPHASVVRSCSIYDLTNLMLYAQ
jgi:hypothetical protein